MVAFRQGDAFVDSGLYVVDNAAEVAPAGVGRDDYLALDVLAVDSVRSCGRLDVGHLRKRYHAPFGVADGEVLDAFDG